MIQTDRQGITVHQTSVLKGHFGASWAACTPIDMRLDMVHVCTLIVPHLHGCVHAHSLGQWLFVIAFWLFVIALHVHQGLWYPVPKHDAVEEKVRFWVPTPPPPTPTPLTIAHSDLLCRVCSNLIYKTKRLIITWCLTLFPLFVTVGVFNVHSRISYGKYLSIRNAWISGKNFCSNLRNRSHHWQHLAAF